MERESRAADRLQVTSAESDSLRLARAPAFRNALAEWTTAAARRFSHDGLPQCRGPS